VLAEGFIFRSVRYKPSLFIKTAGHNGFLDPQRSPAMRQGYGYIFTGRKKVCG